MTEPRFDPDFDDVNNVVELRLPDVKRLSAILSNVGDHVLVELFRPRRGSSIATPQKMVFPYRYEDEDPPGASTTQYGTAMGTLSGGTTGVVNIFPHLSLVGSVTDPNSTTPTDHINKVMAAYTVGETDPWIEVPIAENLSGNPRIDLIYETVSESAETSVNIYLKAKGVPNASPVLQSVPLWVATTSTLAVVQGTPAATPGYPALPADTVGNYNVPIAYVLVPDGYTTADTIPNAQLMDAFPPAVVSAGPGAVGLRIPNQSYLHGGTVTATQQEFRSPAYMSQSMAGGGSMPVLIMCEAPVSHADDTVIDDSIDWRCRFFRCFGHSISSVGTVYPVSYQASPGSSPNARQGNTYFWLGQSFRPDDNLVTYPDHTGTIAFVDNTIMSDVGPGTIRLHVRTSDGALVFRRSANAEGSFFFWIDYTNQWSNNWS